MAISITYNWKAVLDDAPDIDLSDISSGTSKLEFHTSIFSPFPYVEWSFLSNPNLLENGYLLIGTPITFHLQSEESGETFSLNYKVLKIQNGPSNQTDSLAIVFTVILTSPWFFDQRIESKAYKGTISEIAQQVIDEDLPDIESTVSDSVDVPLTQYRTHQTPIKFLQKIDPKRRGDENSPTFMYTNLNNELEIADLFYIKTHYKEYFATSERNVNTGIINSKRNSAGVEKVIMFSGSGLSLGLKENLWALFRPSLSYLYRPDMKVKPPEEAPILGTFGVKEQSFAPIAPTLENVYTKRYEKANLEHYDAAYSEVLKNHYDSSMKNQFFTLACLPDLSIKAGRMVDIYFNTPHDKKRRSLFSQKYLITSVTHVLQGTDATTTLTAGTEGFVYDNLYKVVRFLHN